MLTIVTIQRLGTDATREEADRLAAFTVAGEPPDEIAARVVEGEPVVLAGLVRGGEYATVDEWEALVSPSDALCLAADGRIVDSFNAAAAAHKRGALPITWYYYPEEG